MIDIVEDYFSVITQNTPSKRCLSCGIQLKKRKNRYCSSRCHETVYYALNRRIGLLRALNTRYATFYFTETLVIMDVMPFDHPQIFSYILPRTPGKKPIHTFGELSNVLGDSWWQIHNQTQKRYMATDHVLQQAQIRKQSLDTVKPSKIIAPAVNRNNLIVLNLNRKDLYNGNMGEAIKKAYRTQAKKHHPDLGGDGDSFRKIHEAYQKLISWSQNPVYYTQWGFPDKWFYIGRRNKWIDPIKSP